jgi:hypothetical protein
MTLASCFYVLLQGFERYAGCQPHEFLAYSFGTIHQGPGLVEPA